MVGKMDFIAEIGINHNGSVDLAKKHIEKAKEAGANIAKFQTYFTETRTKKDSPIFEILKKCELKADHFHELKLFCEELEIDFCSTPFCIKSAELLKDLNCSYFKIASFHLSNLSLINQIFTNSGAKKVFISTGVSSTSEIVSVNKLYDDCLIENKPDLTFFHCISKYPIIKDSDNHLQNIRFIRDLTSKNVGFSDHSIGCKSSVIATALGARIIEKHFTIDNNLEGADHKMSANPSVFSNLVKECNSIIEILGHQRGNKPYDCENEIIQYRFQSDK